MAGDNWHRNAHIVRGDGVVGMAQPGSPYLDEHFAPNRIGNVNVLGRETSAHAAEYGRLHDSRLPTEAGFARPMTKESRD
jgi:hypothetical protein